MIQLLIEKGADVAARDENGRTALDWAVMQGDTAAAQLLRKAGAVSNVPAAPGPAPIRVARTPLAAVEAALAQLQQADPKFIDGGRCISCHHQTLPSIAAALAQKHGAKMNAELAAHPRDVTVLFWEPKREEILVGRTEGMIGGFAEEHLPSMLLSDALAIAVAAQQQPDGSWNVGDIRPPLFDASPIHYTALAIRALAEYMPPGRRDEASGRIARGLQFLRRATPSYTQDEAFKLLGFVGAKAPDAEVAEQRGRVLALQADSGGWAQRPTMATDAYETGQVLYACMRVASTNQRRRIRKVSGIFW